MLLWTIDENQMFGQDCTETNDIRRPSQKPEPHHYSTGKLSRHRCTPPGANRGFNVSITVRLARQGVMYSDTH